MDTVTINSLGDSNKMIDFKYCQLFYYIDQNPYIDSEEYWNNYNKCYTQQIEDLKYLYNKWFGNNYLNINQIGEYIFEPPHNRNSINCWLKSNFCALLLILDKLNSTIKNNPEINLKKIQNITLDIPDLLSRTSYYFDKTIVILPLTRRKLLYSYESYAASKMINDHNFNEDAFGSYSIRPAAIFLIRQSIELRLKNSLGIYSIATKEGKLLKIPRLYDYLLEFITTNKKYIVLPVKPSILLKIYRWTNGYIHRGALNYNWNIEMAYTLLDPLFTEGYKDDTWYKYGSIKIKRDFYNVIETKLFEYFQHKNIKNIDKAIISMFKQPESIID